MAMDVPVNVELDKVTFLSDSSLVLQEVNEGKSTTIPFQVKQDARRTLNWIIVTKDNAAKKRTFRLVKGTPLAFNAVTANASQDGNTKLVNYVYKTVYPPSGTDTNYKRSGFIHPLWTPRNNCKKSEYILQSLQNGFNAYADKPMAIDSKGFELLKQAFETAQQNKLLLYDIMTERYEITTILQRELSMMADIFGELRKGTPAEPAIVMESAHNFYKYVSGSVVTRPAWFLDANQQGEGITDVMIHLVNLVQWEAFPEQLIDYTKDILIQKASRWSTQLGITQFRTLTKMDSFPGFLHEKVKKDAVLQVSCNGQIDYQLKGINVRTSVIWSYQTPGGTDTHYSLFRGTRTNLVIRQGKEENYIPELYIEPVTKDTGFERVLATKIEMLGTKYNGVKLSKSSNGWHVVISEKLREGHEAHFARVTEKFLQYLKQGSLPAWEVQGMIAKYYTTTKALETALKSK